MIRISSRDINKCIRIISWYIKEKITIGISSWKVNNFMHDVWLGLVAAILINVWLGLAAEIKINCTWLGLEAEV